MKKLLIALALFSASTAQANTPLPRFISKVFTYSCEKRFFEGEGVRPDMVNCVPYQHLGFNLAKFTYNLFQNSRGNNFRFQGRTSYYPGSVCGMPQLDRYTCESSPQAQFGLSEMAEGPYVARVQMIASPEGPAETYGYAALPDRFTGECPDGLEKSFVFAARVDQQIRFPLPTNMLQDGSADDYRIMPAYSNETYRDIVNVPALTACDGRGFCRWPDGRANVSFMARYEPVGQAFCVIPVNRLVK